MVLLFVFQKFLENLNLSPDNKKLSPDNNFVLSGDIFLWSLVCFSAVVLYAEILGNDSALRLIAYPLRPPIFNSKTNKYKEKPTKQGGFTNKKPVFLVRIGFYWFLNDAKRMLFSFVGSTVHPQQRPFSQPSRVLAPFRAVVTIFFLGVTFFLRNSVVKFVLHVANTLIIISPYLCSRKYCHLRTERT